MSEQKSLGNENTIGAVRGANDLIVFGNPDKWVLICKASSEAQGWAKSTKAYQLTTGSIVQVTSERRNPDGSWTLSEALQFVPNLTIHELKRF